MEDTEFDAKVITKDETGAIVMKIKEVDQEEKAPKAEEKKEEKPVKRKRGRPKGSKNKKKK
jgi:hypothetical protein